MADGALALTSTQERWRPVDGWPGYSARCAGCASLHRPRGTPRQGEPGRLEYYAWQSMIQRCTRETHPKYRHYGGRGIAVCSRWTGPLGFQHFLADMGLKPDGLTLDRIDNGRGYEPGNCRWATYSQQNLNRRSAAQCGQHGP